MKKISVSIEITEEELKSILITAIEGGTGYWAEVKADSYDPDAGTVTVRELDVGGHRQRRTPGPWIDVTLDTIAQGLQRCAAAPRDEGGWAFTTWLADRTGDAGTADNVFQFGVLNELRYG